MADRTIQMNREIAQFLKEVDTKNRINQSAGIINALIKKGGTNNGR